MNYELKKKKEKEVLPEKDKSPLETYGSLVDKLADFKADPEKMHEILKTMEGLYLEAKKEKKKTEEESDKSEEQSFELMKDELKEDQQRLAQIRAIEKAAGFNTDKTEAAIEKEIRDENADIQKKAKVLAKSQSYRSAGEKTPTEGESSEVQEEMEDSESDKENKNTESELKDETIEEFLKSRDNQVLVTKEIAKETIESTKDGIKSPASLRRAIREHEGNEEAAKKMLAERLKNVEEMGEPEYVDPKKMNYELFSANFENIFGVKAPESVYNLFKKIGFWKEDGETLAFYNPNKHKQTLPDNAFDFGTDAFQEAVRQETVHGSTRGKEVITPKAKKLFKKSYIPIGNSWDEYLSNPVEMLPRKQELVRDAEKIGIIKPGADFEDKDVDKLIEHYDNNPEDFSESVLQLLERIDTVTPEGRQLLKKVLNEIAKNENKKENDDNYKMAA